ncbi:MAG: Dps family protein [Campylobacter sp.]
MSKVISQLNQIQADAHALFVKFHDYHWNVKGLQFFSIHEYTQKAYEDMAEIFDDMAERAIQLGGKAIVSTEELNKIAHPKPAGKTSYTPNEVLTGVLAEYEHLLAEFKKLENLADENKDSTTVTIAQDKIAKYEKAIWMLKSTIA